MMEIISEINECASQPCQHGGVCKDEDGYFSCNCDGTGYVGRQCKNGEWFLCSSMYSHVPQMVSKYM